MKLEKLISFITQKEEKSEEGRKYTRLLAVKLFVVMSR